MLSRFRPTRPRSASPLNASRLLAIVVILTAASAHAQSYRVARHLAELAISRLPSSGSFHFSGSHQVLGWGLQPWLPTERHIRGSFTLGRNGTSIVVLDSADYKGKSLVGYTYYDPSTLAKIYYGDSSFSTVDSGDFRKYPVDAAIYSPRLVLAAFLRAPESQFERLARGSYDTITFRPDDAHQLEIQLDPRDSSVRSVRAVTADGLYGDEWQQISFENYHNRIDGTSYPTHLVERANGLAHTNGIVVDAADRTQGVLLNDVEVTATDAASDTAFITTRIPADYRIKQEQPEQDSEVKVSQYASDTAHGTPSLYPIYFLSLPHSDTRTLLVRYPDCLLVANAPLTTENGLLILRECHAMFPNVPVRYFSYGHSCRWSIGGIRAFVHGGAQVIAISADTSYLNALLSFPHTLKPDVLTIDRKSVRYRLFDSSLTIGSGELELRIVHIGDVSAHRSDYVLYYFPNLKLLYEDDLMWITDTTRLRPAGIRQKGLFQALKQYGMNVDTIVPCWALECPERISYSALAKTIDLAK